MSLERRLKTWALPAAAVALTVAGCTPRRRLAPQFPLSRTTEEAFRAEIPAELSRPAWAAPRVEQLVLANGLRAYFVARPGSDTLAVSLVNRRMARHDARVNGALLPIAARLITRDRALNAESAQSRELASTGAALSAYSDAQGFYVNLRVAPIALRAGLRALADTVAAPPLDEREFSLVLREQREAHSAHSANGSVQRQLVAGLFGEQHPYAAPHEGTDAQLASATLDGLRQLLRERMLPQHSAIVLVGDAERASIEAALQETVGRWTVEGAREVERPTAAESAPRRARPWHLIDTRSGVGSAVVSVGWPLPRTTDAATVTSADTRVLGLLLGATGSGLFDQTLRERALVTYGVDTSLVLFADGGYGFAATIVPTDNAVNTVTMMIQEMERLREFTPTTERVSAAKRRLLNRFYARFETPSQICGSIAALFIAEQEPSSWSAQLSEIDAVTPRSVQIAAWRLLGEDRRSVVIAGNGHAIGPMFRSVAPHGVEESEIER